MAKPRKSIKKAIKPTSSKRPKRRNGTRRVTAVIDERPLAPVLLPMGTPRLSFSGHETFSLRYGWLSKGVELALSDPAVFFDDAAITALGVGKNMVGSIRHWCDALGLVGFDGRLKKIHVSALGAALFSPRGFDPYLENNGTLWVLQWQLCRSPRLASTWNYAFTRWNKAVFTRDELCEWLLRVAVDSGDSKTSAASIKRDVDVFVRTYVAAMPDLRKAAEDSLDCPLAELGLMREIEAGTFQFFRQARPLIPPAVLAAALVEYWTAVAPGQRTLTFERVLYGPGSPGGVFQLSEVGLAELLVRLPKAAGIVFDESAGMRRLVRITTQTVPSLELLKAYYREAA
jgi:hypothetical protein